MWRFIAQSVQGGSHAADNSPCQDSCAVRTFGVQNDASLVACAADGAGSARFGGVGARLACESIVTSAQSWADAGLSFDDIRTPQLVAWCEEARKSISEYAEKSGSAGREFATTLCLTVSSPRRASFLQIGDGAIVAKGRGVYGAVFWPQSGEYVNSTHFLTQPEFHDRVLTSECDSPLDDIALLTDGLERLALRFDSLTPHPPFFEPLFAVLRSAPDMAALDRELSSFLKSESISQKTDDDRTLVLASRIYDDAA
ncbi:MAG TPA: PP2C family serine/threonine-protein phosphatase [Lacipirellulaceae bacterium]|nr:PP2C family serine/threonine-protein phosphatase [Lacipirellulaceae bacterium]HMP04784.1 PP2C family serine/threonine-protein phosphatase [Lacipirellulaceae bacterium]